MRSLRVLGWRDTCKLRSACGRTGEIAVQPKGYAHPIYLRGKTTDRWVFEEVIISREYSIVTDEVKPRRIVDAGANAGYGALYFLNRWPEAEIVCIEPDPENLLLAEKNLKPYPKVKVVHGALTANDCMVNIVAPEDWKYAIRVESTGDGQIPGYSMRSIWDMVGWDSCDLVKIDIEGGELDVFANSDPTWLDHISALVIELHEQVAPGCTSALFDALYGRRFTLGWRGENLVVKLNRS